MDIKRDIAKILREIDEGKYSNIALNEFFNSNIYAQKEKNFISEVVYGVIRNKILLDYIISKFAKKVKKKEVYYLLKISVYQAIYMRSDEKGIAWEATEIVKKVYGKNLSGFVNGVLRNVFRNYKEIISDLEKEKKYEILYSYPKWIFDYIKKEYKDDYVELMKSYKIIPNLSVRVNKLKYTCEKFEKYLSEKNIKVLKKVDTIYYLGSGEIINSQIFKEGKIFVQDASSYLAAKFLDAKENDIVLDACAAPGSKTLVLAELMENKGEIIASDIYPHKLNLIEENAKKAGVNIIKIMILDAGSEHIEHNTYFDKILLDVPCSGFGVIRKKPETLYNKTMKNIEELSDLQYKILKENSKKLKINGELIYSTCTIFDEENINNIERFLSENTNFVTVEIEINDNIACKKDKYGGIFINYQEKFLDSFYFIKMRRVREYG